MVTNHMILCLDECMSNELEAHGCFIKTYLLVVIRCL